MRIAVLGTGQVAAVVTPKLLAAGHSVIVGSRTPERAPAWTSQHGRHVTLASHDEAIVACDVVVNALPGPASVDVLARLADGLDGKILMDLANAVAPSESGPALVYPNGSLAEQLRAALPQARVVKAMNTVSTLVMEDPVGLSSPTSIFVSGDDERANGIIKGLLGDLGWPEESIVDLGGLETARGPEHLFLLLAALFAWGTPRLNLAVVR